MFKVKRVKNGATHFATSVAKAGNINGFTADETKAVTFDAKTADTIKAFYGRQKSATPTGSVVTCVPLTPPVEPKAVIVPAPVVVAETPAAQKPVEPTEKKIDHKPAATKSHGHK